MTCESCGRPLVDHKQGDEMCIANRYMDAKRRIQRLEGLIADAVWELNRGGDIPALALRLQRAL